MCYCTLNGVFYSEHYGLLLHSRWTVVFQVEWCVLHEHNVEVTAQHMDRIIEVWMVCVTVKYMWKLLHSMWAVIFQVEWSVLQQTLCGNYCTAVGQFYRSLNWVCYSEHYVEFTAQQVDRYIAGWMEYGTVNFMWKLQHSMWAVLLQVEWSVLH